MLSKVEQIELKKLTCILLTIQVNKQQDYNKKNNDTDLPISNTKKRR